jgi:hypothetical protein
MPDLDCSAVPNEAIGELHRQAEICLQGTLQLATALDQRAITTSGIFAGGALALLTAAAAMSGAARPIIPFVAGAIATATILFLGAFFCARAARSIPFFVAGYEPRLLLKAATDKHWILRYAVEDMQTRIDHNRLALEHSSRLFRWGRCLGFIAVPCGVVAFLIVCLSGLRFPF